MGNVPESFHTSSFLWWMRQAILFFLGFFFLIFGIQVLVSSYKLGEPFSFILTFFASNFIILISATLLVVFAYQAKAFIAVSKNRNKPANRPDTGKNTASQ